MKLKLMSFVFLFVSLSLSARGFKQGGESSGGGGNASVAEFQTIAIWTLNSLSQRGKIKINNRAIDISAMSRIAIKAKIQATDEKLFLNGVPVTAINYPDQKLIRFNEPTWLSLDHRAKIRLCLHEFWGLTFADHEDDSFVFSSALVDIVSAVSFEIPSQIVSAQSTDTDLNGNTFRAMVTKTKDKSQDTYQIIFEKITELPGMGSIITSHIAYSTSELPVKAEWGFQNLRLGKKGFEFELNYFLPEQVTCLYPLPQAPIWDFELEKIKIKCRPSPPGKIPSSR